MNFKTERFYAVVESGSCSPDYKRWEERASCNHAHKSIGAALNCLAKKQKRNADGSCSALWYNATIHNQNEERVTR